MEFGNAKIYRDYFHVYRYWGPAAGLGAATCIAYLIWAILAWKKNSSLWAGDEVPERIDDPAEGIDMMWLDY